MKKLLIIFFILFGFKIYAIDIQPYWDPGEVKLGGVFQNKNPKADFNGSVSVLKFGFYDLDTGFSFLFSPLYFDKGTVIKNDKNPESFYILSFINTELAFNTLYKLSNSNKYVLNLFTSFHVVDPTKISNFQLNTGIEFAITSMLGMGDFKTFTTNLKLLSIRTGFRYMQKQPIFFFDIGVDIGFALALLKPDI